MHLLATLVCPVPGLDDVCANVLFLIGGYDKSNMNYVCNWNNFEYTTCTAAIFIRVVLLSTLATAQLEPP